MADFLWDFPGFLIVLIDKFLDELILGPGRVFNYIIILDEDLLTVVFFSKRESYWVLGFSIDEIHFHNRSLLTVFDLVYIFEGKL
jgi:hypothetical protein